MEAQAARQAREVREQERQRELAAERGDTAPEPSDAPAGANEECVGPQSEQAGKAAGCAGCPNQDACASGEAKKVDPAVPEIAKKLKDVKKKILILSGKGGVGKSTVSAQMSFCFCSKRQREEAGAGERTGRLNKVGLLDIDICGPSVPQMLGVTGRDVHNSADGWSPVYVPAPNTYLESNASANEATAQKRRLAHALAREKKALARRAAGADAQVESDSDDEEEEDAHLAVMSIGFMLPSEDDAVVWRGPRKNGLIRQFLSDVAWGELDYLLVDTPPGTSDEHMAIVGYMQEAGIDGAVLVTTPQEVALADVRKELNFCKKVGVRVLGVVENMGGFLGLNSDGVQKMCIDYGVPYLGKVPFERVVGLAGEKGVGVGGVGGTEADAKSREVAECFDGIFEKVVSALDDE